MTQTETHTKLYDEAIRILNETPNEVDAVIALLEKAADRGSDAAMVDLGYIYDVGQYGVPANKSKAVEYYKMAAELGNPIALTNLAGLYLDGVGVKKNKQLAAHYAALGAVQGGVYSQWRYGRILLNGDGVQKSIKRAMPLLQTAAEKGNQQALEDVEYINNTYALNYDFSIKKSSFKRGIGATLIALVVIISSFFGMMGCVSEFIDMEGINRLIVVPLLLFLGNILCAVLVLTKTKTVFKILGINLLAGLLFVLLFGYLMVSNEAIKEADSQAVILFGGIAFLISLILFATLFIRNSDKMSFASALLEDNPTVNMLYELGNTKDYSLNSQASRQFSLRAKISLCFLGVVVLLFSIYMIMFLRYDITISGNAFDSPLTLFFFFATIPLSFFTRGFTMITFIKYKDEHGIDRTARSDDMSDRIMEGVWPIIGQFVILPAIVAVILYYIIYGILNAVSIAMPYIFAIIAMLLLLQIGRSFKRFVYKKYRQKLLGIAMTVYSVVYLSAFTVLFFWGGGRVGYAHNNTETDFTQINVQYTLPGTESSASKPNTGQDYPETEEGVLEDFDLFLAAFFSGDLERQIERVLFSESTLVLGSTNQDMAEVNLATSADTWKLLKKIDQSHCEEYTVNKSGNEAYVNFAYGTNKLSGYFKFIQVDNKWYLEQYFVFDPNR